MLVVLCFFRRSRSLEERTKEKLRPKQEYEKQHVQQVTSWYLEQKPMREKEIHNMVGKSFRHAYQRIMRSTPTFCYGV